MLVMVYVYLRISCVVANRHDDMVQIKVQQVRKGKLFVYSWFVNKTPRDNDERKKKEKKKK